MQLVKLMGGVVALVLLSFSHIASAGHLFTQASTNTPINLTSGKGIQIEQASFEGAGVNGNVSIYFDGDWDAGDALKVTIGSYTQTFDYDDPLAGTTQNSTSVTVSDSTLAALNLDLDTPYDWTLIATAGDFTLTGYRIYTLGETFNGTGAAQIDQSQVVDSSDLDGGVFQPVADETSSGAAQVLDDLNGSATGDMATVISTMAALSESSRAATLKKVAPESSQALSQAASQTVTGALDTVQVRLNSIRTGADSSGPGLAAHGHDSEHQQGMASGDGALSNNIWLKGFGGMADQDAKDGFAGYDSDVYGMALGADAELDNRVIVGTALAYARTDVSLEDFRDGDGADVDTYQLTAYASKDFGTWYGQVMLAYATQDYETSRNTGISGVAKGDFSGEQTALRTQFGRPFELDESRTLTPYVGLEYNHIYQESYTEQGAGPMSLSIDSQSVDRVRSTVGVEYSDEWKLDSGTLVYPSINLGWRHEFKDEGIDTVTSFVGGGSAFTTAGQSINRDTYLIGAGLTFKQSDAVSLSFELDAEAASGYRAYSAQVVGMWRF